MREDTTPQVRPVCQRLRAWQKRQFLLDTYRPSSRHVHVLAGQAIVAGTSRPVLLIESGAPPRWYIPPGDVDWARLKPVPARTTCQYKGEASYFRVRDSDAELWTYRHPDPEAAAIAGHVATAGQHGVQIIVDATPEPQS